MNTLLTIHERDIMPGASDVETANFDNREAARAVVVDDSGKFALLRVGLHGYHKLPGGGIDEGEDIQTALERELLEEIGCRAEITGEIGEIVEYRSKQNLKQTSYCFTARQVGEKGEPDFTEKEQRDQFSIVWAADIDSAIRLLENDNPINYGGKFIQKRDLAILLVAKNQIKS